MLFKIEQLSKILRQVTRAVMTVLALMVSLFVNAAGFEDAIKAYYAKDYKTAFQGLKPLADQGFAKAQRNLGILYENGQGVSQDYAQAVELYNLAAEQGDAEAQYNLGTLYDLGQGVSQDYGQAVKF